jgi:dipeptidase
MPTNDTEKDLAVHVAICEERYSHITQLLKEGEKRMAKIEYLLYGVMLMVLLGPGVAGTFFHKFFGL